jgi:colicin import membrane protein
MKEQLKPLDCGSSILIIGVLFVVVCFFVSGCSTKEGPFVIGKDPKSTAISGSESTGIKRVLKLLDIYRIEIARQIQKNWAFSEQLAGGGKDLEALVAIKIMPNGEIKDIWFDKRSGNRYLDETVEKAIRKSNPLPPLPKGYLRPFFEAGFRFTPEGIM